MNTPADLSVRANVAPARLADYVQGICTAAHATELGFLLTGAVVGLFAWNLDSSLVPLLCILVLPLAWGLTANRMEAILLMGGYYLGSSFGVIPGIPVFFGQPTSLWLGLGAWLAFAIVATIPFALLWSTHAGSRPWRFLFGLCLLSLPPMGAVGMVSPLAVSGVLFPWLGWFGLVLTLGFLLALGYRWVRWMIVLMVMSLVANGLAMLESPMTPAGWQGVDTHFSGMASAGTNDAGQVLASMRRIDWLTDFAKTVPKNAVLVLPETVLGSVNGLASVLLNDAQSTLRARGSLVLAGAELPLPNGQYENAVMVLGLHEGEKTVAVQSIPVPIAMWKPWAPDGAAGDLFGRRNHIRVKGVRVAVMVCYEQLLSYSLLMAMWNDPKLLVAVSNVWWAQGTSLPAIQHLTVGAIARLFGVATVRAKNI